MCQVPLINHSFGNNTVTIQHYYPEGFFFFVLGGILGMAGLPNANGDALVSSSGLVSEGFRLLSSDRTFLL